jgi:glycosyltransferase involved in cell wall biosynthesis
VPLLAGYRSVFLCRDADLAKPWAIKIPQVSKWLAAQGLEKMLLGGYTNTFERQLACAAQTLGVKVVMRAEFSEEPKRRWWKAAVRRLYLRWLYPKVDAFAVIGEQARRHLRLHGVAESRMAPSPYNVDTDLFAAQKQRWSRAEARRQLGYAEGDFVVMFSGKLILRKDPLLLVRALGRLAHLLQLKLLLVGDGPQKSAIVREGERLLPGRILNAGFVNQSQLGRYYRAADLFVLPSWHETWGLVVNEAMQFGLPALVSDRVGCRDDLIQPGATGWVFPAGDEPALAALIERMAKDLAGTRTMGGNAEKLIERFTVQAAADGILQALHLAN